MKTSILNVLKSGAAPLALSAALLSAPAFAQTAPAPADESAAIVVTGTISRNPAAATASPVTTLTSEDLARRGETTISDTLQNLTANNAGTDPGSWSSFGFATGASTISLRGLNDAYTLILFDGLRTAPYPLADDGTRTIVDVNSIPESIVSQIDVLQDGASATYGSDAVAGVVNIQVKKEVEGVHLNGSGAISQRGDAGERRLDATIGYGKLSRDGFNIYINGEYQLNDPLALNQRGYPFNTADLSGICGVSNGLGSVAAGAQTCEANGIRNGLQAGGTYAGFSSTTTPYVRPYSINPLTGGPVGSLGGYQLANPTAGCAGLTALTLTAAQRAVSGTSNGQFVTPATVCQQDLTKEYRQYDPRSLRRGGTMRGTVKLGDNITAYAMANYYQVKEASATSPSAFTGVTAGDPTYNPVTVSAIYLPQYVCANGVGMLVGGAVYGTGCNAGNGTLNPNNPFAAAGQLARFVALNNVGRETFTNTQTYRISGGLDGSLDGFDFGVEGTHSEVTLDRVDRGYLNVQSLLNAVAKGTFNFTNSAANSTAAEQSIFPDSFNHAISKLTEVQGHVGRDLLQLPGGMLNVTLQAEYRYEAIHSPSQNPANANADNRYFSLNPASVNGSRSQYAFDYDVAIPVFDKLRLKAEGSYEHYSTGQHRFSPKFELEFTPVKAVKIRGTYGKGFRIPNFVEAFGSPTTGFVGASIPCATFVAFCAAHANNPSYYNAGYNYGLTSVSNPNLNPEKSTNFTAGVTFEPTRNISLTADYWYVRINGLIIGGTPNAAVINQYYTNNGVVTVPGFTVTQGVPDPQNLNALPLLGTVVASFSNAGALKAEGVDMSATLRIPIGHNGVRVVSKASATYLSRLEQTNPDGTEQRYDGTLGPCNITSCSGAPKWRAVWENSLEFSSKANITLTAYYTGPYSEVSTDLGGVYGSCQGSANTGNIFTYQDGATPVQCTGKASFDLDLTGSVKIADHITVYGNILNLINQRPTFDANAAYGLYEFNPAWQDKQFIGRYFRNGAKLDF